jgi:hypothetical protein
MSVYLEPRVGEESTCDAREAINIVFISEGFTADKMRMYRDDDPGHLYPDVTTFEYTVHAISTHLFDHSPFDKYALFFQTQWINLVSEPGSTTPLEWRTWSAPHESLMVNMNTVRTVLTDAGLYAEHEADVVVVVVNVSCDDPNGYRPLGVHPEIMAAMGLTGQPLLDLIQQYHLPIPTKRVGGVDVVDFGYSTGIAIVPRMRDLAKDEKGTAPKGSTLEDYRFREIAIHEIGHAFAGLWDEYDHSPSTFARVLQPGFETMPPNIVALQRTELSCDSPGAFSQVASGTQAKIAWREWIAPDTVVPVSTADQGAHPERYAGIPGLFVGGGYQTIDTSGRATYRSQISCRMGEDINETFCSVCREALVEAIYRHPDAVLINRTVPDTPDATLGASHRVTLAAHSNVQPFNGPPYNVATIDVKHEWTVTPGIGVPLVTAEPSLDFVETDTGEVRCGDVKLPAEPAVFEVSVRVRDDAPFVRRQALRDYISQREVAATVRWHLHIESRQKKRSYAWWLAWWRRRMGRAA